MSRKRSNGEGSITQRGDGRWQAALQVAGRRVTAYGKTRAEAAEKLQRLLDQARGSGYLPTSAKTTVEAFLGQWLDAVRPDLRTSTLATYSTMVRQHILPQLGSIRLQRLTPLHLVQLYTAMRKQCGGATVAKTHQVLHKALKDAKRWGLLSTNPAEAVATPKTEAKTPDLWTPDQVQQFVWAMLSGEGGRYGLLYCFLMASGLRLGEALGLTLQDLDTDAGSIRVTRQVTEVAGKPVASPPKTKAGVRTVTLPQWGLAALRQQVGSAAADPSTPLFRAANGSVPLRSNVLRSFRSVCERLGLPTLRVHDLRHLHASLLAHSGVPVKTAQARLGHSRATTTLSIYTHVLGDGDRHAADALGSVVALGPPSLSASPPAA